jgi:hypothetical protein
VYNKGGFNTCDVLAESVARRVVRGIGDVDIARVLQRTAGGDCVELEEEVAAGGSRYEDLLYLRVIRVKVA